MYRIKTIIKYFKIALVAYEEANKAEELTYNYLSSLYLADGICGFLNKKKRTYLSFLFNSHSGHYKNYVKNSYIYDTPWQIYSRNSLHMRSCHFLYKDSIRYRIKFLKTEIIRLDNLLKKGYTHI